jgi:hypothetical protein
VSSKPSPDKQYAVFSHRFEQSSLILGCHGKVDISKRSTRKVNPIVSYIPRIESVERDISILQHAVAGVS